MDSNISNILPQISRWQDVVEFRQKETEQGARDLVKMSES